MGNLHSRLDAYGLDFARQFSAEDVQEIKLSRNLFLSCSFIPALLYYGKLGSDDAPKFPATISHTIREDLPKYAHHFLWSLGWLVMYSSLRLKTKSNSLLSFFFLQMFATGVITTFVCTIGKGKLFDQIHTAGALLYMLDHHLLFYLLRTKWLYRLGFYLSFASMLCFASLRTRLLDGSLQDFSLDQVENKIKKGRKNIELVLKRKLWWYDLMIMFFENSLFILFVVGMTSGLPVSPTNSKLLQS